MPVVPEENKNTRASEFTMDNSSREPGGRIANPEGFPLPCDNNGQPQGNGGLDMRFKFR